MATDTAKVAAKLAALDASFGELEALLEPLFAAPLPETLLALEPLQQAKLQTVLPYIVYDLIFIYLKSRGIDPKTHPVIPELDRIRQYFEKISNAENPPTKRAEIDKAAAGRFIKHAIAQAQWKKTAAETMQEEDDPSSPAPSTSTSRVPVKVTQKMRERAEYEQQVKEEDAMDSAEETLEVFEDEDVSMDVADDAPSKGKGKEVAAPADENLPAARKRRRPAVDVFTGLSEEPSADTIKKPKSSSPSPSAIQQSVSPSKSGSSTPAISEKSKTSSKKSKKKSKK